MAKRGEKIIWRPSKPQSIETLIGKNLFEKPIYTFKRAALIADASLPTSLIETVQASFRAQLFLFSGGEKAKTRETKQKLEDQLMEAGFGKDSSIVSLGGGVTSDLAGFLAATYMRGVELILIPTSLLAMVDAAFGGKCGVNTPFGKNLIGATYLPKTIYVDLNFLATLSEREKRCGLAEVIKYGLIQDLSIWKLLKKKPLPLDALIPRSIQCKLNIAGADPLEKGLRRILNFGHTVAHALESLSNYSIPHGEAVALGLIAESALSHRLGHLSQKAFQEIKTLIEGFSYPLKLPSNFSSAFLRDAMRLDKKSKGGAPRFVQIDRIGRAVSFAGDYCRSAPKKELEALIAWLKKNYG
jgi:3-dehydroquinate synthase